MVVAGVLTVGAGAELVDDPAVDPGGGGGGGLDGGCEFHALAFVSSTSVPSPKNPPAAQPSTISATTTPPIATMRRRQ